MDPVLVGAIVFGATLGGALVGHRLRDVLPEHHLQDASRDTVNVGIGLVATMSALVLGLVTASAKSSFDAVDGAVKETAAQVIALDRLLARYGGETEEIRGALKRALEVRTDSIWSGGPDLAAPSRAGQLSDIERIADAIRKLSPADPSRDWLRSRAMDLAEQILAARWLVFAGRGSSVHPLFLGVLLFWLTITFASFGLFAPRNGTVFVILIASALSVAGAVFLVLELDGPFDGMLVVSQDPLRYAVSHLEL